MTKLRSAVIGVGDFGARHLDVLANAAAVELVAWWMWMARARRSWRPRYGVPHVFTDWRVLLEQMTLDTVHIVTPDTQHFEPAMAALQRGIDIFVEKPLSSDLAEARAMIDEARRLGAALTSGAYIAFRPGLRGYQSTNREWRAGAGLQCLWAAQCRSFANPAVCAFQPPLYNGRAR